MITEKSFFRTPNGKDTKLYSIRNRYGCGVDVTDLDATIVNLFIPDRNGKLIDVALGFEKPEIYWKNPCCFGRTVGRVANRIGNAGFVIDGIKYNCIANERKNSLHGGGAWFSKIWRLVKIVDDGLTLAYDSPDGEGGYPGNLTVEVTFTFFEDNRLQLSYSAVTDHKTPLNLTNHVYFNLAGGSNCEPLLDHLISSKADYITETDNELIPTGKLLKIADTVWDLCTTRSFADILKVMPKGFDDNLVLGDDVKWHENIVTVFSPTSGIRMRLSTSEPGVQFYMGGCLEGISGKGGVYKRHAGFCLETQKWPDAPNHDNFPSIFFAPGNTYNHKTIYSFDIGD